MLRHRREGLTELLEGQRRRDGGGGNLGDGCGLAPLFLGRGAVRQVKQSGEEQSERKRQGHQTAELEPI